jgi:high frequency lysogenization protein
MISPLEKQTLALAGVFQAAALVDQIAKTGEIDSAVLKNCIQTILNLEPSSFEDVFNGRSEVSFGLKTLKEALAKNGRGVSREVLQYSMAIIAVQNKIVKRNDLLDELTKGLERAVDQQKYFDDYLHEAVIGSTARCYQNSISQLSFRIRVTGNPTHLQNPKVAEKVRAILLYGVRCALLWRQSGGRRWHFMVHRQKLKQSADSMLDVA